MARTKKTSSTNQPQTLKRSPSSSVVTPPAKRQKKNDSDSESSDIEGQLQQILGSIRDLADKKKRAAEERQNQQLTKFLTDVTKKIDNLQRTHQSEREEFMQQAQTKIEPLQRSIESRSVQAELVRNKFLAELKSIKRGLDSDVKLMKSAMAENCSQFAALEDKFQRELAQLHEEAKSETVRLEASLHAAEQNGAPVVKNGLMKLMQQMDGFF
eukprot:gnl/Spiro4/5457_TR2767_c0_g6_i1.p1 gnl/Spiro4/5457_TR2767_c0_g6~~gnl/Spiro4/5457_TR2767_c0_g6_i1.p1  ORF type:complete len:213 (-),score=41.17 gnl/Spiro4/5457_TR2767_c0_g6_i1:115-753(-)